MDVRFINAAVIREVLTPEACIEVLDDSMRQVSQGEAHLPLRSAMHLPGGQRFYGMMPGYLAGNGDRPDTFGIKLISLFPGNARAGRPSHLGLMVLNDAGSGEPLAVLDADVLTSLRTAAASALATRALSRPDSRTLAIIGTGEEARSHIPAMLAVRDISAVRVWGRTAARADQLCERFAGIAGVTFETSATVEAAVRHADIVCTVTAARTPVLKGGWIGPGTHVNLVGSSVASSREVDTDLVARSRFYVDFHDSAVNQAGELAQAIEEGAVDASHIVGEIGGVLTGDVPGRTGDREITVYKSLGVLAQDLSTAWYVYRQARERGLGQNVRM